MPRFGRIFITDDNMATGTHNAKKKLKHDSRLRYIGGEQGNHYKRVAIPPPEFALTKDEIEEITETNIGMVWAVVWKWLRRNSGIVDKDDVFQEAMYGWYYGAERYDKRKRCKEGRPIRPQSYMMHWATCYVRKYVRQMICRGFQVPQMHAKGGTRLDRPVSLNYEYSEGSTMAAMVPARREADRPEFPSDFWDRANKFLTMNERIVIDLRYRRGMTLEEIGALMQRTRERMRQIEEIALKKIKMRANLKSADHYT